ncbi:MAG: hypothetical protein ABL869_01950 [Candidatus Nitrotoga sp.]
MQILIHGAGQVGATVAESLVGEDNDITIVDTDLGKLLCYKIALIYVP